MPLALATGVSFCNVDGGRVFLDVKKDSYFCLGDSANAAFDALLLGATVIGEQSARLAALADAGILVETPDPSTPRPCRHIAITASPLDDDRPARPGVTRVLAAAAAVQCAKLELRLSSLATSCARLEALKALRKSSLGPGTPCDLSDLAAAFAASSRIVRALDQCLPVSLAILRHCLAIGIAAELVLGVKLRPFQAHAWVMAGGTLLSDRLTTVRQFTPILVL